MAVGFNAQRPFATDGVSIARHDPLCQASWHIPVCEELCPDRILEPECTMQLSQVPTVVQSPFANLQAAGRLLDASYAVVAEVDQKPNGMVAAEDLFSGGDLASRGAKLLGAAGYQDAAASAREAGLGFQELSMQAVVTFGAATGEPMVSGQAVQPFIDKLAAASHMMFEEGA